MRTLASFLRGAGEALAIMALFVSGGLTAAAGWAPEAPPGPAPALYLPGVEPEPPTLWLVDGYNAIGVGLLAGRSREGWWSSRHRRELLERAGSFDPAGGEVWVVFDGPEPAEPSGVEGMPGPAPRPVREVFAPDADQWLLRRAGEGVALVTADRRLAERARRRGARVVSPGAFLAQCAAPEKA